MDYLSHITAVTVLQRSHYKHLTKSFPNEVNIPLTGYASVKKTGIFLSQKTITNSRKQHGLSARNLRSIHTAAFHLPACFQTDLRAPAQRLMAQVKAPPRRHRQIPKDSESEMQVETEEVTE